MMRRQGRAHVGQVSAETGGLLDGDAFAPRDQVPAHLVDAAALNRTVRDLSLFLVMV